MIRRILSRKFFTVKHGGPFVVEFFEERRAGFVDPKAQISTGTKRSRKLFGAHWEVNGAKKEAKLGGAGGPNKGVEASNGFRRSDGSFISGKIGKPENYLVVVYCTDTVAYPSLFIFSPQWFCFKMMRRKTVNNLIVISLACVCFFE